MESIRQQQVARIVRENMSDVLIREGRNIYGGAFVTLTKVQVTGDLLLARIYLSVYNVTEKQEIVDKITANEYLIKRKLGNRMRNKLRRIPELEFYLDETLDEEDKVEGLFQKLNTDEEE